MEELVKVYEYVLSRKIIEKCSKENRVITNKDVEDVIQRILEDNNIAYKNKLVENWEGFKTPKYTLTVEIYVEEKDKEKAENLIKEYLNN